MVACSVDSCNRSVFLTDTNGPYPGSSSSKSQSDYSPFSEDPASPLNPDFYPLTDRFNGPSTAPATVMDTLSDAATSLLEGISAQRPQHPGRPSQGLGDANSNPDLCSDLPINRLANRTTHLQVCVEHSGPAHAQHCPTQLSPISLIT
ncbi:uncharacterized protein LOC135563046 isoform X1 [Oncorhynchus nerka]|uniref:uncharacterized protein LOC135563046 isoform X1 n=1 Tax=Oncorhynchus nerka TaxID=8023 RepID=UPI0031B81207